MTKRLHLLWNSSLARQLIAGITLLFVAVLGGSTFFILTKQKDYILQASLNQVKNRTVLLARNSAVWVASRDYIGMQELVDSAKTYNDEVYIAVVDTYGKVLAHTDKSKVGLYLSDSESVKHLKTGTKDYTIISNSPSNGKHILDVAMPIIYQNQLLGYIRNSMDIDEWYSSYVSIQNNIFLTMSIIFVLAIAFIYFVVKNLLSQISNLVDVVMMVKNGNMQVRANESGVLEIKTLAREFNRMLDVKKEDEVKLLIAKEELEDDNLKRRLAEETINELNKGLEATVELRTKELIVAKDRAESANKAKSIFLANMSHELRTPLNAILGFSQLLVKDRDITESQRERLNIINSSGEHLLKVISDILDMSKIEAGKVVLVECEFDLIQTVQDIAKMMNFKTSEKNLDFQLEIGKNCIQYLYGDKSKLVQILINILSNSVKYTDKGGIFLRVNSEKRALPDFYNIIFEIEDSGRGMSAEEQKIVYEPFVQLQSARGVEDGTGLGLAITKKFLELLDGKAEIKSQVDIGTLFKFSVSMKSVKHGISKKEQAARKIIGISGEKNYKVLIVEDQLANMLLLKSILHSIGIEVVEASNGIEAVDAFKKEKIDFIWMDIRMPIMDGCQATKIIRTLENGHSVPIVGLTASAFYDSGDEALVSGCDSVLHKPYKEYEIFETISKYLGIQYIYEDEDSFESGYCHNYKISLTNLPSEAKIGLKNAIIELESAKIAQFIGRISEIDYSLANYLSSLVSEYKYKEILEVLEQ